MPHPEHFVVFLMIGLIVTSIVLMLLGMHQVGLYVLLVAIGVSLLPLFALLAVLAYEKIRAMRRKN